MTSAGAAEAEPWGRRFSGAAIVAALVGIAVLPFVPLLLSGLPLSGAYGLWAEDELQDFAWIREAAHHVLAGNRFDLAPGPRTFVHPVFTLSGLLHAATGLAIPASHFVWVPVAIAALLFGFRRYVQRLVRTQGEGRVALWLALFYISPLFILTARAGASRDLVRRSEMLAQEMWSAGYLWAAPMIAITVALMPLVLLGVERWREDGRARTLCATAAGAFLVSWLHPWQGATLALVIVGVESLRSWRSRTRPSGGLLVVMAALTLPALYYVALTHFDPAWKVYHAQTTPPKVPRLAVLLAVLPLAVPAAFAYRSATEDWQEQAVRAWPFAALVVYLLRLGAFPFHAFQGLALPLSVLAVQGARRVALRRGWAPTLGIVAVLVVLTVPGAARSFVTLQRKVRSGAHGYFITADERRALLALERDTRPGGVLAEASTGALIPYVTGREVYVGHPSWSPGWDRRVRKARELFSGGLHDEAAVAFVRSTHARYLLADCQHPVDLTPLLASLLARTTRYGCATLYELKERPDMSSAAGRPDE